MIFVNFNTVLLETVCFYVIYGIYSISSICTFLQYFFNSRTVFGVALLRLPNFCIFVSGCFQYLPGTFVFTLSGIFNYDTICLVAFLTIGTSIGFFALLFGVFASFHWFRFQVFAAPLVKLTGTSMGSPLAPIIHMYPYQFNKSILLPLPIVYVMHYLVLNKQLSCRLHSINI